MKRSPPLNEYRASSGRGTRLQGERGEIETRRPALGAVHELAEGHVVELDARAFEQRGRVLLGHREVVDPDLEETTLDAQAGRRNRELFARGDRELRPHREMPGEIGDRVAALRIREHLGVVEHEDDRLRHRTDRRHQAA